MIIKLNRDYEVKCTLGTIKDLEGTFKKPFTALASELAHLTAGEQIKLLYAGVRRADASVREADFTAECEERLGLGELADYLEQFIYEIQYPNLTREEAKEKMEKKLREAQKIKASTGLK